VVHNILPPVKVRAIQVANAHNSVPFDLFPNCYFALDTTFVSHPHPSGLSFEQAKEFFSVKHSQYGYKWLVLVNSSAEAIFFGNMFSGAVHDFSIAINESVLPHLQRICGQAGVLCDKGFVGLEHYLNAIVPIRSQRSTPTLIMEQDHNLNIAKSRIVVENFFGRMKVLWTIFLGHFKIHVQHMDDLFHLAVYLTDIHIHRNPVRKKSNEVEAAENTEMPDEYDDHQDESHLSE